MQAFDQRTLLAKREGPQQARQKFRTLHPSPSITKPLQLVQIDHTLVDVIVVDELERKPIGRPWLTVAIDVATRAFLANDLKLTLVCAGTANAKRALATDRQLADRFRAIELPAWVDDDSYHRFLVSFATVLPLQGKSDLLFAPLRRSILQHSEGVLVRIVGLLKELAIEAIQPGRERIDRQSLPSLPSLAPLISMQAPLEPGRTAL